MVTKDMMDALDFDYCGKITLEENNKPRITIDNDIDGPCVYAWLTLPNGQEFQSNKSQIFNSIYVGKAGYGLHNRMNQHFSGFSKSIERDMKRANKIKEIFECDFVIYLFARPSHTNSIANLIGGTSNKKVSLYDAEEAALHHVLAPYWPQLSAYAEAVRRVFPGKPVRHVAVNSMNEGKLSILDLPHV